LRNTAEEGEGWDMKLFEMYEGWYEYADGRDNVWVKCSPVKEGNNGGEGGGDEGGGGKREQLLEWSDSKSFI
jgi:hypothetical protein